MRPEITIRFDLNSVEDYRLFLRVKSLPRYRISGRTAIIPAEYADRIGVNQQGQPDAHPYTPAPFLFDYQRAISEMAIRKRKFAGFVKCGLGKTSIFFEYARHVESILPPGQCVLIVSPLMVIGQTLREAARFYGDSLPIERVKASDLGKWLESGTGRIGITNYDALNETIPQGRLGSMILDECFPADTLIDCINDAGEPIRRPIQDIRVGDRIVNAQGQDTVIDVHRREVQGAIIVHVGAGITSSPSHPFFTQRGWVCAQDLEPGDSISLSSTAMRMVRGDLYSEDSSERSWKILRSILLSEMEDEPTGIPREDSHARDACQDGRREEGLACGGFARGFGSEDSNWGFESDEQSGDTSQDIPYLASHEPRTFRAWGQWPRIDDSTADHEGCSWRQLDHGVCLVTGATNSRISHLLQTRLGEPRDSSRHRGGWFLPLGDGPEGAGREEGCQVGFTRVDGIEVLEPGDPRLERFRNADGKLYFYDLEAERHPSYSVNGLLVHNSSMLKSSYGKWGQECIRLGKGLDWKLSLTGTPAPNDRIEFANQAVFLDAFPNVNSFLAKFFVNRGQTDNRWEIKPHALMPFYRALSDWSIFLNNPATYGWKDNAGGEPPIIVHIEDVELTAEQQSLAYRDSGTLFPMEPGGITSRSVLSQIAKGHHKGKSIETLKPEHIRRSVESWPDESTIIWCHFNPEQELMHKTFPGAANIAGSTPMKAREELIEDFQSKRRNILISKGKVLGFGLNLQVATRHVFSGLIDSYEVYHQCVKRSNRVGSTEPLHVHIPITEIERPMIETVLKKAARVDSDAVEMEGMFKHAAF